MTERPRLRKRPLEADAATTARADEIDIAGCASIAYSSEDPAHPLGATYQREDQRFNLHGVTHLRLTIVPNKNGPGTATLTALRLFV